MSARITRREFLKRSVTLTAATWLPSPALNMWNHRDSYARAGQTLTGTPNRGDPGDRLSESVESGGGSPTSGTIPTRFFYPGYTQADLDRAFAQQDLVNGFPWGVADVNTLGGIAEKSNISIDADGSAVFTLRQPSSEELRNWEGDAGIRSLIEMGERNGLVMKLSAAAMTGRIPTDVRSIEISITLPSRILAGNSNVGMSGIGWTFWTVVDGKRLVGELARLAVPEAEINQIKSRVDSGVLEEDIAEFSLGEPTVELGYPLWVRLASNQVMTFMAGRKTMTAKSPRIDIMHKLFEPMGVGPLPLVNDRTVSGWLASDTLSQDQVLKKPLRAKLEIGDPVYDPTRDARVVPMTFSLNAQVLRPTKTIEFPGLENDPTGAATPNLSLWQIKTSRGDWVTIPRQFILNISSSRGHTVTGTSEVVRFSDLVFTRKR